MFIRLTNDGEERYSNINSIESIELTRDGFAGIRFISSDYIYTNMKYNDVVATVLDLQKYERNKTTFTINPTN
jgi:hypothetical protein